MKKRIGFVLALILLLTAVGCANSQKVDSPSPQQTNSVTPMETAPMESQAAADAARDHQNDEIDQEEIMRRKKDSLRKADTLSWTGRR